MIHMIQCVSAVVMKMILVAMVTFDKQLFMKLDSLLLLLSPPYSYTTLTDVS